MNITLNPDCEQFAARRARELGYADVSQYMSDLLRKEEDNQRGEGRPDSEEIVERMRGKATGGMSTDEVMRLTRGEQ